MYLYIQIKNKGSNLGLKSRGNQTKSRFFDHFSITNLKIQTKCYKHFIYELNI